MCTHKTYLYGERKKIILYYQIPILSVLSYNVHMSRDMTKPTKWVCAQWSLRSAWASAQSDQSSLSAWRKPGSLATHEEHSECPGWSESSLHTQTLCWFCHVAAHIFCRCTKLSRAAASNSCDTSDLFRISSLIHENIPLFNSLIPKPAHLLPVCLRKVCESWGTTPTKICRSQAGSLSKSQQKDWKNRGSNKQPLVCKPLHYCCSCLTNEPQHNKTNKMMCVASKLRSACASAHSDQFSLCAQLIAKDHMFLRVDSKDSDQTGQKPRLIRVFAGHTSNFVLFCHAAAHMYVQNCCMHKLWK